MNNRWVRIFAVDMLPYCLFFFRTVYKLFISFGKFPELSVPLSSFLQGYVFRGYDKASLISVKLEIMKEGEMVKNGVEENLL